jgi:predicted flap endonuclease-1-like 5' DNA nuclease
MTAEEMAERESPTPEMQIADLKQRLTDTDYKAIKYAEGLIPEEEYAPVRVQRQAWRDEINRLEGIG